MKHRCYLFGVFVLLIFGCNSQKQTVKPTLATDGSEVTGPCSGPEYVSDSDYFRVSALALGGDEEIVRQKTITSARVILAADIQAIVKAVSARYFSSYEIGVRKEDEGRFWALSYEVVHRILNKMDVICEKIIRGPGERYQIHVAIELNRMEVLKALKDNIADDRKLRLNFKYEEFEKIFDEEMKKTIRP